VLALCGRQILSQCGKRAPGDKITEVASPSDLDLFPNHLARHGTAALEAKGLIEKREGARFPIKSESQSQGWSPNPSEVRAVARKGSLPAQWPRTRMSPKVEELSLRDSIGHCRKTFWKWIAPKKGRLYRQYQEANTIFPRRP